MSCQLSSETRDPDDEIELKSCERPLMEDI